MQKPCSCGRTMSIRLRTVIFKNKVEIDNVPIFSCEECSRSEVYPPIKSNLTGLIGKLGIEPGNHHLRFDEVNELANLMRIVTAKENRSASVASILENRINELLDLLIIAQSLHDESWIEDIRSRLSQISGTALSANDR